MGTSPTSSTVQWFMRPDRTLGSLPVALEVAVELSGTRTASDPGKRELFAEPTQTTLVFEDGAVVRLSAPVEIGQLLFLKNVASQQEVVARVLRQRSFGAAAAYVELEFSEAVPGFWGELPAVEEEHATGPASDELAAAAQFLAEEAAEDHSPPVAKPDDGEVARLRDEIAGLRQQMTSLLESSGKPPVSGAPQRDLATKLFAVAAADSVEPRVKSDLPGGSRQESVAHEVFSPTALGESVIAGSVEVPEQPSSGSAVSRRISYGLIAASLLLVFLGVAYYQGFLKNRLHRGASNVASRSPVRAAGGTSPKTVSAAPGTPSPKDPVSANGSPASSTSADKTMAAEEAVAGSGDSGPSPDEPAARKRDTAALKSDPHRDELTRSMSSTNRGNFSGSANVVEVADEEIVPPALLKAVNPVAPPDAVRGFVTGDVKCDALVDAKGKVASANVISGPAPLRQAALEALRLYQYKPATKNGQAVPGHVEVTLKFWYEP